VKRVKKRGEEGKDGKEKRRIKIRKRSVEKKWCGKATQ